MYGLYLRKLGLNWFQSLFQGSIRLPHSIDICPRILCYMLREIISLSLNNEMLPFTKSELEKRISFSLHEDKSHSFTFWSELSHFSPVSFSQDGSHLFYFYFFFSCWKSFFSTFTAWLLFYFNFRWLNFLSAQSVFLFFTPLCCQFHSYLAWYTNQRNFCVKY